MSRQLAQQRPLGGFGDVTCPTWGIADIRGHGIEVDDARELSNKLKPRFWDWP
jgi:hypothetical protein